MAEVGAVVVLVAVAVVVLVKVAVVILTGLTLGAEVTTGWCNELWDIETGTEQAGKAVERKGSYAWAKDLEKRQTGLRPTHFTGEWKGLDLVAGDGKGGKSHSFKLKHTALL